MSDTTTPAAALTTSADADRHFTPEQFALVQALCAAPSPIGFEAAMIDGVIVPELKTFAPEAWQVHRFVGSSGMVVDTKPGDTEALTVMIVGHADNIRLQVRSIGDDGKIWVNSESFLPTAIIGHRFDLIIEDPSASGTYRVLPNLTAQAFGAIHFAPDEVRKGQRGVEAKQLYLETGLYGPRAKERLEELGVRPGQPAVFSRRVERGPTEGTFFGAHLDNALGCFTVLESARALAAREATEGPLANVRLLFAFASHEEVGLYGSRVAVGVHRPDILVATDVTHDFVAAPDLGDRRMPPVSLGSGAVITSGTVHSYPVVNLARRVAADHALPLQLDLSGSIEGNDSMAAVLAAVDAASLSLSFPIRNMHTSSELGCDGDVLAAIAIFGAFIDTLAAEGWTRERLKAEHIDLKRAERDLTIPSPPPSESDGR